MGSGGNEDRYIVPGLLRGLEVLRSFTHENPTMSLSEIARKLGISRSAAFRAVYTLTEAGCLLHDDAAGNYTLGPGVLRLTHGYTASREVLEAAQPELEYLNERLHWAAHLGVRDDTSVLYLLRISSHQSHSAIVQIGSRLPARNTALGRVMLAGLDPDEIISIYRRSTPGTGKGPALPAILDQARNDAATVAVIHEGDFEARIVSAAAPLRDSTGRVVAAISLTAPKSTETERLLRGEIRDEVLVAAERISALLGWPGSDAPHEPRA